MLYVKLALLALFLPAMLVVSGCEDYEDWDYKPPEGMGALIVDNRTSDDADVFVDGADLGQVGRNRNKKVDLAPGVYRLVIIEQDGDRNIRGDVDILAGKLTIVELTTGAYYDNYYFYGDGDQYYADGYDVRLYFD